jgi:hypothetical protein
MDSAGETMMEAGGKAEQQQAGPVSGLAALPKKSLMTVGSFTSWDRV